MQFISLHAYQLSQMPYHIFQIFVVDAIVSWELFPFLADKELSLITLLQSRSSGFITYNFGKAVFTLFAHKMHYSRVFFSWNTKMLLGLKFCLLIMKQAKCPLHSSVHFLPIFKMLLFSQLFNLVSDLRERLACMKLFSHSQPTQNSLQYIGHQGSNLSHYFYETSIIS